MYCSRCNKTYTSARNLNVHVCVASQQTVLSEFSTPFIREDRRFHLFSSPDSLRRIVTHYARKSEIIDKWLSERKLYHVIIGNKSQVYKQLLEELYVPISGQRCTCINDEQIPDHEHYIGYKLPLTDSYIKRTLLSCKKSEGIIKKVHKCKPMYTAAYFINVVIYIQRETAGTLQFAKYATKHTHSFHTWTIPHTWKQSTLKLIEGLPDVPEHWLESMRKQVLEYKAKRNKIVIQLPPNASFSYDETSNSLLIETNK